MEELMRDTKSSKAGWFTGLAVIAACLACLIAVGGLYWAAGPKPLAPRIDDSAWTSPAGDALGRGGSGGVGAYDGDLAWVAMFLIVAIVIVGPGVATYAAAQTPVGARVLRVAGWTILVGVGLTLSLLVIVALGVYLHAAFAAMSSTTLLLLLILFAVCAKGGRR